MAPRIVEIAARKTGIVPKPCPDDTGCGAARRRLSRSSIGPEDTTTTAGAGPPYRIALTAPGARSSTSTARPQVVSPMRDPGRGRAHRAEEQSSGVAGQR
jgi:hypothetical protein